MLAPEDESRAIDALRFSLASDIVELVVLTIDDYFLQTLREAVGAARRLWHVPSPDKVSDLLVAGGVGILVLDVPALNDNAFLFIAQIKRQFPDLVIVVAGSRGEETTLARLISDGTVYRFIHKPMSPARARLFADAAVKRYDEQRRRTGAVFTAPAGDAPNGGLWFAATFAVIFVILAAIWATHRAGREDIEPARVSEPGTSAGPGTPVPEPPAGNPSDDDRHRTLTEVQERLLARAESALLEERLNEAAVAIESARKSGVESGRIAFLTAQLAKARESIKGSAALARLKSAAPRDPVADAKRETEAAAETPLPKSGEQQPPDSEAVLSDSDAAGEQQPLPTDLVSASRLDLLKSVAPIYPKKAEQNGVEGWVELDFTVTETGEVKDPAVHAANPAGVFDQSAIAALLQWRYKPVVREAVVGDSKSAEQRARIRIRFTLAR